MIEPFFTTTGYQLYDTVKQEIISGLDFYSRDDAEFLSALCNGRGNDGHYEYRDTFEG